MCKPKKIIYLGMMLASIICWQTMPIKLNLEQQYDPKPSAPTVAQPKKAVTSAVKSRLVKSPVEKSPLTPAQPKKVAVPTTKPPLIEAIIACNNDQLCTLLNNGEDPNMMDQAGKPALAYALDAGLTNAPCAQTMIKNLLAHGACPQLKKRKCVNPLAYGQKILEKHPSKNMLMSQLYLVHVIESARTGNSISLKPSLAQLSAEEINSFMPLNCPLGTLNPLLAAVITEDSIASNPKMIKNKVEVAAMLIKKGAECDLPNDQGICPLDVVIKHDCALYSSAMLKVMITNMPINQKNAAGKTVLHRIIEHAPANALADLIQVVTDKKADINLCDNNGCSPLICLLQRAEKKKHSDNWAKYATPLHKSIELLKKNNVDCLYVWNGKTALELAHDMLPTSTARDPILQTLACTSKVDGAPTISTLVQTIMRKQALTDQMLQEVSNINQLDPKTNMTPLMAAVYKNNIQAMEKLLNAKADPNMHNNKGATPLSLIIENMSCGSASISIAQAMSMIQPLMQAGANPEMPSISGKNALQYARARLRHARQAVLEAFNTKENLQLTTAKN